jgi:protein-tyrosine phosphatase/arsenate reductase
MTGSPATVEEVTMSGQGTELFPELAAYIAERLGEADEIPTGRTAELDEIAGWVGERVRGGGPARLVFICTHNSRRSHMAQLWAEAAARLFDVPGVETFSGGTESTAFNPRAVSALQRAGFLIEPFTDGANPIYEVSYEPGMEPTQAFSKAYDAPPNPRDAFAAVMTCSAADAACPLVFGAAARFAIPYDDPKEADSTEGEAAAYDERCRQIAREMLYLFAQVARG